MRKIIKLKKEDSARIAEIHIKAFPGFFLSQLGIKVLKVFYSSLILNDNTIVWGITKNDLLVGFFAATKKSKGFYLNIFKNNFHKFFIPLILVFLQKPSLFKRMIVSFKSTKEHIVPSDCNATLLSICVSPEEAGKGIGKLLLEKLENELIICNIASYYLTTDADNNESTNLFYSKSGFRLQTTYSQGNRSMNLYIKEL